MFIQKGGDMTTITSHSLPLIPLQPNLGLFDKRLSGDICTMNGVESVLPHSLIRLPSPKREQSQMSPQDCYGSENSQSNSICDMDPRSIPAFDSKFSIGALTVDDRTSSEVARSNSVSSYKGDNNNKDDEDEYMNYCSDDSELSVGKEVDDAIDIRRNNNEPKSVSSFRLNDSHAITQNNQLTLAATATTASSTTKLPNIVRPNPTRQEEFLRKSHMYAEEIMKHQINFMTVTKGLNVNSRLSDNAYSPYPNELSPIHNAAITNPLKIGFSRLQAYANDNDLGKKWSVIEDRNARSPEATHFRQIHSHLNAISKITSALGRDNNTRIQMTSPAYTTSRESSQSPPSSNASSSVRHMHHNNFNETSLKFSIDNILKPSFGRRITDPLLKRNKPTRKSGNSHRTSNTERTGRISTSIDSSSNASSLTTNDKKTSSADQTGSKALSNVNSNTTESTTDTNAKASTTASDSNSKGPLSWPAWVYCTRYSDRPSSGKIPCHLFPFCSYRFFHCFCVIFPAFLAFTLSKVIQYFLWNLQVNILKVQIICVHVY